MGEQIENNYIVSLVKSKLPANFNLKLEESKSGDWTVKNLQESINKLIVAKERSEEYPDNVGNYEYSIEGMFNRDIKVKCIYCEKSHWSDEWQRYKNLMERKGQLRGRCFVCLSDKHRYRECTSYKACFYCKRKGNHHQSLCPEKFSNQHPNETNEINDISGIGDEISVKVNDQVIMKSAQINIRNQLNGKECHANILLDTGAKRTYITVGKAKLLGLKMGPLKTVRLNTFGSVAPNNIPTNETKLSIKHKDGTYKLIYAKVCKTITGPMKRQHLDVGKYKHIWKELEMVSKIESKNGSYNIDLLIGSDYYEDILKAERIQIDNGLYLVNSSFGWMFSGRYMDKQEVDVELIMFIEEEVNDVNQFWMLDTIGISDITEEKEEEQSVNTFKNKLVRNGNRYKVGWPWKISKYELPSNFKLCESRLKSLVNQMIEMLQDVCG